MQTGPIWLVLLTCLLSPPTRAEILTPPYFNLAEGRNITASATCGESIEGPELYCKLVGANEAHGEDANVIQGQFCYECDPTKPEKRHPPEYAVDGLDTWWQSPPLSRGMKYNEVNLTIELGQEFHVAYIFIRMGNSPRPALWILEKSADYGKTWEPWQYFSDSPDDCQHYFGKDSLQPITRDNSVVCTTEYSKIVPLEGGEIPISLLNNRPSANHYFNSTVLQEWTRATNIRFRFLRTKNLLGHLMSVARQDPTVTRRYFYSIKDISIGGRCMCNGHADTCDIQDPQDPRILLCRCQHNTCGAKCQTCCPGFVQNAWRQSKPYQPFVCEPCNCFEHSNECVYDPEIDRQRLSLDIHGKYEGGGVCQNCQHNTEGINCNHCKAGFYRPYHKAWNETDVCQPCACDNYYSTGNCAEGSGQCECKPQFQAPNCDSCSFGYYDYPLCKACDCHLNGTRDLQCEAKDGQCPCHYNFGGKFCKECADTFYGFPECNACECDTIGSVSATCDRESGNCSCKNNFAGKQCNQCQDGFYAYPSCTYCGCDIKGTVEGICDKESGKCLCKEGYGGERCDICIPRYYDYPDCKPCNCSAVGSASTTCDPSGKCPCLHNFAGKTCEQCSPGYYKYPECLSCNCNTYGSIGISCDGEGVCQCQRNFDGIKCDKCKEGFYNFPSCEDCNCHPAGVVAGFAGCGSVPAGELCQCKERVEGRICDKCKPLYWNLNPHNPDGCEECNCYTPGVLGGIGVCDSEDGQCVCKPSVVARGCSECADGTYDLREDNLFGCVDCECDIGGSISPTCDKTSGQCMCHSRVMGRTCKQPLQAHYFPTLYQYQYEVEDGRTPSGTAVRYSYDESVFPDYSWKGYAVFSLLQKEILYELYVQKPSLYRMVLRYVNRNADSAYGNIKIIPDNPNDNEQELPSVNFKPINEPTFVTVSGIPLVMNPGRWTVKIKVENGLFLDYFVLLPEDFYLASILNQKVENPCKINQQNLCKEFSYPNVTQFDTVWGSGGFTLDDYGTQNLREYFQDADHLNQVNVLTRVPLLNNDQPQITYNITVSKPGQYILIVNYITSVNETEINTVQSEIKTDGAAYNGSVVLYACPYTTVCRQVLKNQQNGVGAYRTNGNWISVTFKGNNSNIGIHSLAAIPLHEWSLDFIKPKPVCTKKDGQCTVATFQTPPESKKIQFEQESEEPTTTKLQIVDFNGTSYVFLNPTENMVDLRGKVPQPGYYVFVVHYYQPDYPEFDLTVLIQNGQFYENRLPVAHCPSKSGCRATIVQADGNNKFSLIENFMITLKEPDHKHVYLDYVLVIPADIYTQRILQEDDFDRTGEFLNTCGSNHFNIDTETEGFCRDSVFSITAGYNNGALSCQCDYDGSLSFECDPFGGQCSCKPNIIGRKCEACRTGYYGFPECKPCNCPSTAYCKPNTGQCICPPHVTGERCDQCEPYTYGYDPLIGCEECKCNPLGVLASLQCDLNNGSCPCKPNIVGRKCDSCRAGHFSYPYCEYCDCVQSGTTEEICDQASAECFCKKNVRGPACNFCVEGTYNLQAENPDGCTECFCFGKTTRCVSSTFVKVVINELDAWTVVAINETDGLNVTKLDLRVGYSERSGATVDFIGGDGTEGKTVYFAAPAQYLGRKMSSYGGKLNYTIYYAIGYNGKAVSGADVILQGADTYLKYEGLEQPPSATEFVWALDLVEQNFLLPSGIPAKREHIMSVLQNLKGIYLRATYWSQSETTSLLNAALDSAIESDPGYIYREIDYALTVEQCQCPPNYQGLSCEECAPGYYRIQSGPHGGYCVPCQCNGHSNECDVNTGVCLNCNHNTRGDHCEVCDVGYHGNALQGTPMDCLICACPLPIASNNFATGCDVSSDGEKISCECIDGYFGARCQSCKPGHYGRPEQQGDYCKPCQCSGNIDPDDVASCDTVTGECLRCLNNTYGVACALCAPGYFGDAVNLKDCQACVCDKLGTDHCDSYTGDCICKNNVVGEKCDRCVDNNYGFSSGNGCVACNCAEASESNQCEDADGQCRCKDGVAGRACDRCAPGYWNYTSEGCVSCGCKSEYSRGFGCNAETGQCECLPGVIGEKCDQCPRRWVFIPDYGCAQCDSCIDDLLDDTDYLRSTLGEIIVEFDKAQWSVFTSRRLTHLNDTLNTLKPKVHNLDAAKVDLKPIEEELQRLEQDAKNTNRKANYSLENSDDLVSDSEKLRDSATDSLDKVAQAYENVENVIEDINALSQSLSTGEGPRIESALQEAEEIYKAIKIYNLTERQEAANQELAKVQELLDNVTDFRVPVEDVNVELKDLNQKLENFQIRLDDLYNNTQYSLEKTIEAEDLIRGHTKDRVVKKYQAIENQTAESEKNLKDSEYLRGNASKLIEQAKHDSNRIKTLPVDLDETNRVLKTVLDDNDADIAAIKLLQPKVQEHAQNLSQRAQELDNLLSETRDSSNDAIQAANAYKNIVDAIRNASSAANEGLEAGEKAAEQLQGVEDKSLQLDEKSEEVFNNATELEAKERNLKEPLEENLRRYYPLQEQHNKNKEDLTNLEKQLKSRQQPSDNVLKEAEEVAVEAESFAVNSNSVVEDEFKELPVNVQQAKQIPKVALNTTANINQVEKQLQTIHDKLPSVLSSVNALPAKESRIRAASEKLQTNIEKLKAMIDVAREMANKIKVGVRFNDSTVLELQNPPNLNDLSTSAQISGYFKTKEPNGMVLYLGNEIGTKLRRTDTDDFLALVIENGYPSLILDVGNGVERVLNEKFVADDKWYQFIIDRTGNTAKLTIREELSNGSEILHVKEKELEGPKSIFNLDKDRSKLCVGSCPVNFRMQQPIQTNSFIGEMEDLVIGDTPVGLWNFNEGYDNSQGAPERTQLLSLDQRSAGCRFDGHGYVISDGRSTNLRHRFTVELKFKTSEPQGLLFLIGGNKTFTSLELRNGKVLYQYNLGQGTKTFHTTETYNDGKWHKIRALRDGDIGKFYIDDEEVTTSSAAHIGGNSLEPIEKLYFGGYPPAKHPYIEVTSTGFDGCIDDVNLNGNPVDLNRNVKTFGTLPGCPVKFARLVSFSPRRPGYLKQDKLGVQNDFRLQLRFKTNETDGLIFYGVDTARDASISLSLKDGHLVLISQKIALTSKYSFNDSDWHVVSVVHNETWLRFDFDDYGHQVTDSPPPPLHVLYGDLYFGGLPSKVAPIEGTVGSAKPFIGCIADAILNGTVLNFANSTDKLGEILGKCVLDLTYKHDFPDILTDVILPDIGRLDGYTTRRTDAGFDDIFGEGVTRRGDGGDVFAEAATRAPPQTEPPTTNLPARRIISQPSTTTKKPELDSCMLPMDPVAIDIPPDSFRFSTPDARLEYPHPRGGRYAKNFTYSLEFRSESPDGIIFFVASDTGHYVIVYLRNGKVVFTIHSGSTVSSITLESENTYDDNEWHNLIFSKEMHTVKLVVDDNIIDGKVAQIQKLDIKPPFYIGGLNPNNLNTPLDVDNVQQFKGCIRNFFMNDKPMENPDKINVLPCSDFVEEGVFFNRGGGYIRLREKFKVGLELDLKLDIKPRNISGVLVAVHGKRDFLVLEMIDGSISLTVNNGRGPISTSFTPGKKFYFCDGNWHHIQAVKSKSVVTLSVDNTFTNPGVGDLRSPSTDTGGSLFLGGHRLINRARGIFSRVSYVGCIRNVFINDDKVNFVQEMIEAGSDITLGTCPTN